MKNTEGKTIKESLHYDCQICGKTHTVSAVWGESIANDLKKHHDVILADEIKNSVQKEIRKEFALKHPGEEFLEKQLRT